MDEHLISIYNQKLMKRKEQNSFIFDRNVWNNGKTINQQIKPSGVWVLI